MLMRVFPLPLVGLGGTMSLSSSELMIWMAGFLADPPVLGAVRELLLLVKTSCSLVILLGDEPAFGSGFRFDFAFAMLSVLESESGVPCSSENIPGSEWISAFGAWDGGVGKAISSLAVRLISAPRSVSLPTPRLSGGLLGFSRRTAPEFCWVGRGGWALCGEDEGKGVKGRRVCLFWVALPGGIFSPLSGAAGDKGSRGQAASYAAHPHRSGFTCGPSR